ncbi:serine/threonine protein kinase [Nonomuraea sediminis]|uniref:serine/threonine protein kinase n=1 Tax=Nonomuraea sediminis TaxID=2835864 RepID=UPI001BDD9166|nr:serine/threonine-protein kinase [Nonomuraea sediminis]
MAADRLLSGHGDAPPPPSQSQGRLIGRRYRLMSPVGRGGMGMVWHAHDVLLDRDVAVKELILPYGLDHAGKQVAHRRMLREARSAARLTHPGIVTVHDVVEEDGRPWIVMELVRAWSLEQAVRQSGPLPVVQAAEIGIRVLDALRHAHAAGILHRDIKPGNVLLTSDRVVLTDFGIAAIEGDVTITQTGLLMGSPAYIPPERLSGQPITVAADLWSFGATLYAAVEGHPPYEGPDAIAVLGAVLTQPPIGAQRAGALLPVIDGLLRKDPAERLTAEQVGEQLEQILRAHGSNPPRTLPSQGDPTPAGLLPPLDPPSGPMPSRIVETPSGPVRVPYDPLSGPSDAYAMPYDSPSGAHRTDQLPQQPFDAFASHSGPLPVHSGPAESAHDVLDAPERDQAPDGPHRLTEVARRLPDAFDAPPDGFGGPSGPYAVLGGQQPSFGSPSGPQPILPLTTDAKAAPWPLASPDDLREHSRDLSRDLRSGQSGAHAIPERPLKGRRRPSDEDGGWIREGRPTLRLIVTAVAVAGAAVAVFAFLTSGGSQSPATTASPLTAQQGSSGEQTAAVPGGFKAFTPPGFTAAVPDGWKLASSSSEATFSGPKDSGMKIKVVHATPQADGGLAVLGQEEAAGGVDGYIQVQLQAVKYRDWKATDWEYTYTLPNGVPMHALTRYVTIDDTAAFKITFDLPELKWDDQADARRTFLSTFRPTR